MPRTKSKGKVQAQRKFAQGVPVPYSSTTVAERRPEAGSHNNDNNNVFKTNMSAKNLLDIISFKAVHFHNPIVLLERLPDSEVRVVALIEGETLEPEDRILPDIPVQTPIAKNTSTQLKGLNKRKGKMILRSGLRNKNAKKVHKKLCGVQKKTKPKTLTVRPSIPTPTDSNFTLEDDKPLTFFTHRENNKDTLYTDPEPSTSRNFSQPNISGQFISTVQSIPVIGTTEPEEFIIHSEESTMEDITHSSVGADSPSTMRALLENNIDTLYDDPQPSTSKGFSQSNLPRGILSAVQAIRDAVEAQDMYPSQNLQLSTTIDCERVKTESPSTISEGSVIFVENYPQERVLSSNDTNIRERQSRLKSASKKSSTSNNVKLVDAPIFCPTLEEFQDPVSYFEKIKPEAEKFGICKIVAPQGFNPGCNVNDLRSFNVFNQYIARLYSRWGPTTRELCTIRAHLSSQKVLFTRLPLVGGMELNLPKMYHAVQRHGGLKFVTKRIWTMIAEELNCGDLANPESKLDKMYVKYLVPYESLTKREKQDLINKVEQQWVKKYKRTIDRARNPLQRQKRLLGEVEVAPEVEEVEETEYPHILSSLKEAEDCVVRGRAMNLATFKRVANSNLKLYFPNGGTTADIEKKYWHFVLLGTEHVCVNVASIDTGPEGYGFTNNPTQPYGTHPWNLKRLNENKGNVLRLLGPVLGLTVPTLHLGMIFSTSCWHRDPHGLPWMEYQHTGPDKVWYGIPDEESARFRRAVEALCPTSCQNKSIWLPSDITMIPPNLLLEQGVSLSRTIQRPGEFVLVFPKAYSCSISTGFTVSESVYFATNSWVNSVHQVFQELRESCEPTLFPLEQLLISGVRDPRATLTMIQLVHGKLTFVLNEEMENRNALSERGLVPIRKKHESGSWTLGDECDICRTTLYLSKVKGIIRKNESLCLAHALQVMDNDNVLKKHISLYEFQIFFAIEELEHIIKNATERLIKVPSYKSS